MRPAVRLALFLATTTLLLSLIATVAATRNLNQVPSQDDSVTVDMKISISFNMKGATCAAVKTKVKNVVLPWMKGLLEFPEFSLQGPTCSVKQDTTIVRIIVVNPMPENQYEIMVGYYKEMLSYFKTLGDWAKASSDIKALVNWARRRDIKITRLSVKILDRAAPSDELNDESLDTSG